MGEDNMSNKNNDSIEKYEVVAEEEKAKVDPSKPCDESNPDYPWTACGIDKKPKEEEK